jgi:hypothetical protein
VVCTEELELVLVLVLVLVLALAWAVVTAPMAAAMNVPLT